MIVLFIFVLAALFGLLVPFDISSSYTICPIDPLIGGAIIGGVGSMISGLFGSSGQEDTNAMNYKISRENRDWQSLENEKSRTWEEKMWNASNAYNDPSAVMQRYTKAGLNPYLTGQVGQGASLPSSPSMQSAPNAPVMQNAGASMAAGIQGASGALSALPLNMAEIQLKESQSNALTVQAISEAAKGMSPENFAIFMKTMYPKMNPNGQESPAWKLLNAQAAAQNSLARLQDSEAAFKEELNKGGYAEKTLAHLDNDIIKLKNQSYQLFTEARENLANITTQNHIRRKLEAERSELLSRVSKNVADARKSNADADSIEKYNAYALGFLQNQYDESVMRLQEYRAQYVSGSKVRSFMRSDEQQEKLLNLYEWETSYWKKGLDEAKDILGVLPMKWNFGRSTSTNRNYNASHNTNESYINSDSHSTVDYYPHPPKK